MRNECEDYYVKCTEQEGRGERGKRIGVPWVNPGLAARAGRPPLFLRIDLQGENESEERREEGSNRALLIISPPPACVVLALALALASPARSLDET